VVGIGFIWRTVVPVRKRITRSLLAPIACPVVLIAVLFAAPSAAAAASRAAYHSPGYRGRTVPVPTRPAALPTPIALSPSGRFPDVLVDGAGTSHIVWVTSDGVNADAVHYCRLKRGAGACDSNQVFVPQKSYGDGDGPQFNSSPDGARIVQVGQQIVILDYRYPTVYVKPDGSDESRTVLEWVSEDGGNTFTGPAVVGDQEINGGVVEFGPDNNPQILTATDTVTGGTYVQALVPGQYTGVSGNLGDGGPDQAYSGSLALDRGRPVAAFSDLSDRTLVRRWTGAGSPADSSTWTPASALTVSGGEPKLAGGSGGLFLMNRTANRPYVVRRISGNGAGAPVQVSDANDANFRDFAETSGGSLVAGWESRGGSSPGVTVRSSPDGTGWSGTDRLINGTQNGQLRVGAAGDGGGVAVLNHTGGVNSAGQILALAYGQRRPTGVPGIAGVPGGGDPAATTSCQHVTFGAVNIKGELGCFLHGTGTYANDVVSDGELNINGLRIVPDPGVQIIINPHAHTLDTTGKVSVIAEGLGLSVTLWHGELHVQLPTADAETDLFNFDMSKFAADLDGFPIDAKIDVKLTADGVRIPVDLKLPAVFGGITGHAELVADSQHGLHVDALAIAISNAPIGPLLADFNISYDSAKDLWLGGGKLSFPPRPAGLVLTANVAFARGHFTHGDIDIKPFGYGLPVFTDVYIDDIKGGLDLEPQTVITAGVGIGVIPIGPPTQFTNTMQINGDIAVTIADPFKIEVNGDASLLGIPVAAAHLLFISNGYLSLDGRFDFKFDPIEVTAGINAVVDLPHRLFSAEFKAELQVLGYSLSSVDGIVSSSGIALCGDLPVPPFSRVTIGHHWNHDYTDLLPSFDWLRLHACDLSGYRVMASPARATAAAAGLVIALPHARSVNIAVHGAGGTPAVVLTAPTGKQIVPAITTLAAAASALAAAGGRAAAFTVPSKATTVVVLRDPAAGTWRVASLPNSPAIAGLAESHSLADTAVHAHLLGHGRHLRLRYTLHPRPGLTVAFAELGSQVAHVIGTAHGAHGTLAFTSADGPAGTRRIVALITQDGLPRPRVVLTNYRAPGPLRPGRVHGLRVNLRGHTLTVTFGPASDARGYEIRVTSTDGKHRLLLASATHRSARLGGLGPGAQATVSVTAIAANGRPGPSAQGRTGTKPRRRH
jgi:hypothetical protein